MAVRITQGGLSTQSGALLLAIKLRCVDQHLVEAHFDEVPVAESQDLSNSPPGHLGKGNQLIMCFCLEKPVRLLAGCWFIPADGSKDVLLLRAELVERVQKLIGNALTDHRDVVLQSHELQVLRTVVPAIDASVCARLDRDDPPAGLGPELSEDRSMACGQFEDCDPPSVHLSLASRTSQIS